MNHASRFVAVVCIAVIGTVSQATARGPKFGTSPSDGIQPGGSEQPATPNSQPLTPAAPHPGITNGTLPIEATVLAYQALATDATSIATSVNRKLGKPSSVVILGTSADFAPIVVLDKHLSAFESNRLLTSITSQPAKRYTAQRWRCQ